MHGPIQNRVHPKPAPTSICCSGDINISQHLSTTFLIILCLPHVSIEILQHWKTMESCVWLKRAKLANGRLMGVGTVETLSASLLYTTNVFFFLFFLTVQAGEMFPDYVSMWCSVLTSKCPNVTSIFTQGSLLIFRNLCSYYSEGM